MNVSRQLHPRTTLLLARSIQNVSNGWRDEPSERVWKASIYISSESSSNMLLILQGQCAYRIKSYFLGQRRPRLKQKEETLLGLLDP